MFFFGYLVCWYVLTCARHPLPPPLHPRSYSCLCSSSLAIIVSLLARLIVSPRAAGYPQGHAAGVRDGLGREQARRAPRLARRRGASRRSLVPRRLSRLPPKSEYIRMWVFVAFFSLVRPRPSLAFFSRDRSLEAAGASSVPAAPKEENVACAHGPGPLWRHDTRGSACLFIFSPQRDISQLQLRTEC